MPEGKIIKALSGFYYVWMVIRSFSAGEEGFSEK